MKTIKHDINMYNSDMFYEQENIIMMQRYIDYILQYSNTHNNFLELGIGRGETIRLLQKHFDSITVIDGETQLIDKYTKKYNDIEFIHSFFENYKPKQKFDNIGMGFILDLVDSPTNLLQMYSNFLSKKGKIFISIENALSLHRIIAHEAGLLPNLNSLSESNKKFGHKVYYGYDKWVKIIQEANLKIIAEHGLFLKPFSTKQINMLNLDPSIYNALSTTAKKFPQISNACFFVVEKQ